RDREKQVFVDRPQSYIGAARQEELNDVWQGIAKCRLSPRRSVGEKKVGDFGYARGICGEGFELPLSSASFRHGYGSSPWIGAHEPAKPGSPRRRQFLGRGFSRRCSERQERIAYARKDCTRSQPKLFGVGKRVGCIKGGPRRLERAHLV